MRLDMMNETQIRVQLVLEWNHISSSS